MEQLPESVDHDILEERIIFALKTIRETRGCTLHQALDVFAQRYEELRRDRPDDFHLSREDYGRGFYS
ncbi:hypothetical protein SMD44_p10158 (plasmid) [Streptomyces alboflavus]|uniref:Uncharacterized protein n=1 Tax=Streptomyces alboflavus TaxID=67267 RepID=A0A291W419_9ACTN|nr:hypothetical protein [Streptomyces alboflavus]ATM24657.1 hypothetical protein SMD44_p10158 [Streptomyces alboflavus]